MIIWFFLLHLSMSTNPDQNFSGSNHDISLIRMWTWIKVWSESRPKGTGSVSLFFSHFKLYIFKCRSVIIKINYGIRIWDQFNLNSLCIWIKLTMILNIEYIFFFFFMNSEIVSERPGFVSCDFERAIWAAVSVVLPNAKVSKFLCFFNSVFLVYKNILLYQKEK